LGFIAQLNVATHLLWQMPQQPSYKFELLGLMKVGYCKFQVLVSLTQYGMKHMRGAFVNVCNAGLDATKIASAVDRRPVVVAQVYGSPLL
jgi:hypothetical protein